MKVRSVLYNFYTKPKWRQRKCYIPSAILNLKKIVRFGITTKVGNSRSSKRSSLAVQDFKPHLKKITGKKVQSSLKAEDPSYANVKQFSRFFKNSDSPPKSFPMATHTYSIELKFLPTSLVQSLWEQQQWELTITNTGQISLFVKSIRKREIHTPKS